MGNNIYNKFKIENNIIKILWRVRNYLFTSKLFWTWVITVILLFLMYFFSQNFQFIIIKKFDISNFLSFGITALSFTLAVLSAATRIYTPEEFVQIYCQKNGVYKEFGDLFYLTLAPYIITPSLWLIVALVSLFSNVISISVPLLAEISLKIIYISIVVLSIVSSWKMYIVYINDFTMSVQREINKKICNSSENE